MSAKILVVEDDADINELMGQCLTQAGMKYVPALTGQEGLAKPEAEHPDVLVLDLMLPDIHGFGGAAIVGQAGDQRHRDRGAFMYVPGVRPAGGVWGGGFELHEQAI